MTTGTKALFDGMRVVRITLPLLVAAAWVPSERMVLVDDRLDDEEACEAIVSVTLAAAEQAARKAHVAAQRRANE